MLYGVLARSILRVKGGGKNVPLVFGTAWDIRSTTEQMMVIRPCPYVSSLLLYIISCSLMNSLFSFLFSLFHGGVAGLGLMGRQYVSYPSS